mgnify:FL=1
MGKTILSAYGAFTYNRVFFLRLYPFVDDGVYYEPEVHGANAKQEPFSAS